MQEDNDVIGQFIEADTAGIVQRWMTEVRSSTGGSASGPTSPVEADALLRAIRQGLRTTRDGEPLSADGWAAAREVLDDVSSAAAMQGISPAQTSAFVMALKKPLFEGLQQQLAGDPARLISVVWTVSTLVDKLSQHTFETYQKSREAVIQRQQHELLELSTPVVKLWEGVLAAPMIGTLDSSRTQLVMESLLQAIVDTGSEYAIIDITGVPTVDTLVAQHLLKTATAIRLMGAECIISGVRPQIAQTIVHLGIDLQGITTRASLADALSLALKRGGFHVTRGKA